MEPVLGVTARLFSVLPSVPSEATEGGHVVSLVSTCLSCCMGCQGAKKSEVGAVDCGGGKSHAAFFGSGVLLHCVSSSSAAHASGGSLLSLFSPRKNAPESF